MSLWVIRCTRAAWREGARGTVCGVGSALFPRVMLLVWKDPVDSPTHFNSSQAILNTTQPTVEQYIQSPIRFNSVKLKV